MRIVVLLLALAILVFGVVGLISPERVMTARQQYMVTATAISIVGALRLGLGILLILVARDSRLPRAMRALGALVCVQGSIQVFGAPFVGVDRARAMLEWEAMHSGLLRLGALIAFSIGGFILYAVAGRPTSG